MRRDDKFQWRVLGKGRKREMDMGRFVSDVHIYIMQKGQQREYLVRAYFSISTARWRLFLLFFSFGWVPPLDTRIDPRGLVLVISFFRRDDIHVTWQ